MYCKCAPMSVFRAELAAQSGCSSRFGALPRTGAGRLTMQTFGGRTNKDHSKPRASCRPRPAGRDERGRWMSAMQGRHDGRPVRGWARCGPYAPDWCETVRGRRLDSGPFSSPEVGAIQGAEQQAGGGADRRRPTVSTGRCRFAREPTRRAWRAEHAAQDCRAFAHDLTHKAALRLLVWGILADVIRWTRAISQSLVASPRQPNIYIFSQAGRPSKTSRAGLSATSWPGVAVPAGGGHWLWAVS